jgi:hypothetical protein
MAELLPYASSNHELNQRAAVLSDGADDGRECRREFHVISMVISTVDP